MERVRWWQFGLIGGAALSVATAGKLVRAVLGGREVEGDWREGAWFFAAVFAMGSICGLLVWAGRGLHRRIGWAGDALVGLGVMLLFFLSCMLLFAPDMLGEKWRSGGLPMFGLAAAIGLIAGPWIGRDWRREFGPPNGSH